MVIKYYSKDGKFQYADVKDNNKLDFVVRLFKWDGYVLVESSDEVMRFNGHRYDVTIEGLN